MKLKKEKLEQLIRDELGKLKEGVIHGQQGMTVHPFDNELANQEDNIPIENVYKQVADATIMEMAARYNEEDVKEIIRHFANQATQGPGGVGGLLTDEQIHEVYLMVTEQVLDTTGVNLSSYMPQDREHPNFMDTE
jgi:hypothetical protein